MLQLHIRAGVIRDLLTLWGAVDPTNLGATIDPFTRAGLMVVRAGNRASATASARYYVAFRHVEGVRGTVAVAPASPPPDHVVAAAIRGGGLAGILNARRSGATVQAAHDNGFVKASGAATQLVAAGGRETLLDAIGGDREAQGYQRVTDGDPCAFCAMVASQGIVAYDEDSAGFEAHNHCGCTAEPAFEGSKVRADNERFRQSWDEVTQGLSGGEALNAFRAHLGQ